MTNPLFEIKLLAALDHAQFEEAIWTFEIDGDISTLLLIDYALEQFHKKKVQADKVYRVSEQKNKKIGEQYLGLEKNESYTFAQLLQFLIFTQANDVKEALSNMLFDSVEQAQLILSKRAENYKLTLKAPNQLKNLFLLVKHIYSYPAELKKLFFIRTLSFKNKLYQPITPLFAHPLLTSVLYISHTFRQIYITYSEHNRSIGFFSFLDDIHRLEHLVPYYHYFQEVHVEAKKYSSQTGIINILGDTYFGEMYTEKRKSIVRTSKNQYNTDMSYPIHFRKKILAKLEEGQSIRAVAQHFEINKNTIVEWKKRIEIKRTRPRKPSKVDDDALRADVEQYPDDYQYERAARFGCGNSTIGDALKRLNITVKKRPYGTRKQK